MARSGVWVLLVSLAAPAAAQDAGSFGELMRLVGVGDDVRVTLSGGRSISVQVAGVTSDTLSVVVERGVRRDLVEADVWAVDRRVKDSNANGAWVGFAVGAALSIGLILVWEDVTVEGGKLAGLTAIGGVHGAVGAWVGYGIDRLIRREERVYSLPRSRLSVAPVFSHDRYGAAVSLSF